MSTPSTEGYYLPPDDPNYRQWAAAVHVVAVVAAVIETVFTLRVFNVSLTHITLMAFMPWLAATIALAVFNLKVGEWLGRRRRAARETERMHVELNRHAVARAHAR